VGGSGCDRKDTIRKRQERRKCSNGRRIKEIWRKNEK
jgi:hypothetical protein